MSIVIEASLYCVGSNSLIVCDVARPNRCIEPVVCQNGNLHDWHIYIILVIMLLVFDFLYVGMYTVNNFAQDMKRSFEIGHFL